MVVQITELNSKTYELHDFAYGTYKKYNDGTLEYFGRIGANENGYAAVTLPVKFCKTPSIIANLEYNNAKKYGYIIPQNNGGSGVINLYARDYDGQPVINNDISWSAKGYWR